MVLYGIALLQFATRSYLVMTLVKPSLFTFLIYIRQLGFGTDNYCFMGLLFHTWTFLPCLCSLHFSLPSYAITISMVCLSCLDLKTGIMKIRQSDKYRFRGGVARSGGINGGNE